jgi:hypothetical protein
MACVCGEEHPAVLDKDWNMCFNCSHVSLIEGLVYANGVEKSGRLIITTSMDEGCRPRLSPSA